MNKIYEIRYSVLGQYEEMDSTPDLINSLNDFMKKYNVMPNNITVQTFNNGAINTRYRPQLINTDKNYNVDFLLDRIDILFRLDDIKSTLRINDSVTIATQIFSDLSEKFNLNTNRMAILIKGIFEGRSDCKIINKESYFSEEKFIEWAIRNVHRKPIEFNNKNENINIVVESSVRENGSNINIKSVNHNIKGINYIIDINTVHKTKGKYFSISEYGDFYSSIKKELDNTIKVIERINCDD